MEMPELSKRWKLASAISLVALPALVFYLILCRTAVNLPILDDYQIILGTANSLSQEHSLASRLGVVLTSEHNGYKLMFENSLVWAFHALTGHVQILPLVALGNAFPLVIFLAVALMAEFHIADRAAKILFLAPAAYFIFQLQYASALNFASSSLQHLAVVAFSLLSIYLMSKNARGTFVGSCIAATLAIASSPNGFFLAPVGVLILVQQKRWKQIAYWVTLLLLVLGLYLFHYTGVATSADSGGETAVTASHHMNPIYALSFVGSSAARYSSVLPSGVLGLLLCGVVVLAIQRRYFLQNPAVFYSMIFILINAVAVSGLRSDSGVAQSLASRYRTYSNLMLAFSYMFLVESFLSQWKSNGMRRTFLAVAIAFSMAFCLASDLAGARFLEQKKVALIQSYRADWQNNRSGQELNKSDMASNPALRRQLDAGVYKANLPILRESVRLGVYQPPLQP